MTHPEPRTKVKLVIREQMRGFGRGRTTNIGGRKIVFCENEKNVILHFSKKGWKRRRKAVFVS